MTLQNLIDYYQWQNIDLWDGCTVPEPFNISTVIDTIMSRCGLLTPIYGEPDVFKELTKMWFYKNQWNFEHLAKVYDADYSPIENVYESDHYTNQHSGTDKRALSGTDTDTLSGSDTNQASGSDGLQHGLTTEHQVSAYNSSTYQSDSKDISGGTDTTTFGKKDTMTYGKKNTMQYGKVDTVNYGKKDDFTHGHLETYDRLRHGNIGVTTNNELINQELSMLEKFNPYDWIAAKYERDNFLQIY